MSKLGGKTPYDSLGVGKDASDKEIKDAFKQKAKENHPDKGGDHDKMLEITKAYDILKSPAKKKRYDETGQTEEENFDVKLTTLLGTLFMQVLDTSQDFEHKNLLDSCKSELNGIVNQQVMAIDNGKTALRKYQKALKRLKVKEGKENVLALVLGLKITETDQGIKIMEENLKFLKDAAEVLSHHDYEFDKGSDGPFRSSVFTFATGTGGL